MGLAERFDILRENMFTNGRVTNKLANSRIGRTMAQYKDFRFLDWRVFEISTNAKKDTL